MGRGKAQKSKQQGCGGAKSSHNAGLPDWLIVRPVALLLQRQSHALGDGGARIGVTGNYLYQGKTLPCPRGSLCIRLFPILTHRIAPHLEAVGIGLLRSTLNKKFTLAAAMRMEQGVPTGG